MSQRVKKKIDGSYSKFDFILAVSKNEQQPKDLFSAGSDINKEKKTLVETQVILQLNLSSFS